MTVIAQNKTSVIAVRYKYLFNSSSDVSFSIRISSAISPIKKMVIMADISIDSIN